VKIAQAGKKEWERFGCELRAGCEVVVMVRLLLVRLLDVDLSLNSLSVYVGYAHVGLAPVAGIARTPSFGLIFGDCVVCDGVCVCDCVKVACRCLNSLVFWYLRSDMVGAV
jgi:hypothetical protein